MHAAAMKPWIEVAPSLLDFHKKKPSSTPKLDTILEEDIAEEFDGEEDAGLANADL